MKIKIVLSVFVLGAIVALSMFYLFGTAEAATVAPPVKPSVTITSTLSLAMEDTANVVWGDKAAGTTPITGTIQARVSSNTNWMLTVASSTSHGLEGNDGSHHIASPSFKYTSAAGTPTPSGNGIAAATEFSTSGTNVWTDGLSISDCRVAIAYNLVIAASQYPQGYSATHPYTLTSTP